MTIDGFVAGPNGEGDWVFISGKGDPEALQQMIGFGVEIPCCWAANWLLPPSVPTGKTWPTTSPTTPGTLWRR